MKREDTPERILVRKRSKTNKVAHEKAALALVYDNEGGLVYLDPKMQYLATEGQQELPAGDIVMHPEDLDSLLSVIVHPDAPPSVKYEHVARLEACKRATDAAMVAYARGSRRVPTRATQRRPSEDNKSVPAAVLKRFAKCYYCKGMHDGTQLQVHRCDPTRNAKKRAEAGTFYLQKAINAKDKCHFSDPKIHGLKCRGLGQQTCDHRTTGTFQRTGYSPRGRTPPGARTPTRRPAAKPKPRTRPKTGTFRPGVRRAPGRLASEG